MSADYNSYDPEDEEQDDDKSTASPYPRLGYTPATPTPLPNPVLKNFDTPAAASTDTVPTASTPPPADDSSAVPKDPAPVAPAAPPATAPAPTAAQSASTTAAPQDASSLQPPADPASTASLSDDDASSVASSNTSQPTAQPSIADVAAEYHQHEAAQLKYLKAQGAQTQVLPTGAEVPLTDDDGNQLYHPAVIQPFLRGDDGNGYRISRNKFGAYDSFNLADGAPGQDYHVDPASGDKFVTVTGADGGGKREVIGNDPLVPAINDLQTQLQQHTAAAKQTDIDIAQATNGTQGAGPLRAASLGDLRGEAGDISKALKPLTQQLSDLQSYTPPEGSTDPADAADMTQAKQLQDQIAFKTNRLNTVQGEIDARDSTISDAQQRRTAINQQGLDASTQKSVLQRVQNVGGLPAVQGYLKTLATTGALPDPSPNGDADTSRWKALSSMGLVTSEPDSSGTGTALKVTPLGASLLDDDTQAAIAKAPGKFNVTSNDAPVPGHVARATQALPNLADTSTPDGTPPTFNGQLLNAPAGATQGSAGTAAGTGATAAAGSPADPSQASLPAQPASSSPASGDTTATPATGTGASSPAAAPSAQTPNPAAPGQTGDQTSAQGAAGADGVQPAKAYTVNQDGSVKFDATQPTASLLAAYKGGAVSDTDMQTLLPKAQAAQQALADQQRIAAENPAAWKAFTSGAASNAAFLVGMAPGSAVGSEIGTALGAAATPFVGPEAIPAGAGLGSLAGGFIGGKLAGSAFDAAVSKLAQSNATIRSFEDANALHPNWNAAGGIVGAAAGIPKAATDVLAKGAEAIAGEGTGVVSRIAQKAADSYAEGSGSLLDTVSKLRQQASIQAAAGATAGQIAAKIGGQAVKSAGTMVAVDTIIKQGMKGLGWSDQGQTLSGAAQAGLIGVFLAGHEIQIENHSPEVVADVVARGNAAVAAGATPEQALGVQGAEVYRVATDKIQAQLAKTGVVPQVEVTQATQRGQSYGVASGKVIPESDSVAGQPASQGNGPSGTPAQPDNAVPPTQPQPPSPAASSAPGADVPSAPPTTRQTSAPGNSGGTQPSPTATSAPTGGQASSAPEAGDTFTSGGVRYSVTGADDKTVSIRPESAPASAPPLQIPRAHIEDQISSGASQLEKAPQADASSLGTGDTLVSPDGDRHTVARVDDQGHAWTTEDPNNPGFVGMEQRFSPQAVENFTANGGRIEKASATPAADAPSDAESKAGGGSPSVASSAEGSSEAAPGQPEARTSSAATEHSASDEDSTSSPAASTDPHEDMAALVNRGATTDHPDGGVPSLPFQVLSRLKASGTDVTPETSRAVHAHIADIMAGPEEGRQAALDELLWNHVPEEAGKAASNEPSNEPKIEPSEPIKAPEEPAQPAAPLSPRGRGAQKEIEGINALEASGGTLDKEQLGYRAHLQDVVAEEQAKSGTQTGAERQPVTEEGQRAQKVVSRLTAKQTEQNGFLTPPEREGLMNARASLERDLNTQALGPNPTPTSEAGKAAAARIQAFREAQAAGAQLSRGEHGEWNGHRQTLHDDFTAQRKALDAQGAPTTPARASESAGGAQPPAQSKADSTPPSDSEAPASKPGDPVMYRGRPATVETVDGDGRATVRVHAGESPTQPGVNLVAKRVRGVSLDTLEKPGDTSASPTAPAKPVVVGRQPGDTESVAVARERLGDQRQLGKWPTVGEVQKLGRISMDDAQRVLADQRRAESEAAGAASSETPAARLATASKHLEALRGIEGDGKSLSPDQVGLARNMRAALNEAGVPAHEQPPYLAAEAEATARAQIGANRSLLQGQGIRNVTYDGTEAASGIEFRANGTLKLDPAKIAESMTAVRDMQSKRGIQSTPEDWFLQTLAHESVHAADTAVAHAKGQTLEERYSDTPEGLPTSAMPQGWAEAGRKVYGAEWDALPEWKQKAEFVRQVVEGKWTGRVGEQLYKFIQQAVSYLKQVGGFQSADPRFKAHVEEVESRIASSVSSEPSSTFKRPSRAAVAAQARLVRSLEAAAQGNPDNADVVARYQSATKQLAEMQRQKNLPLQAGETPRTFKMPAAPDGNEDVLDHIRNQGGIVSPNDAKAKPTYDPRTGDYDAAPTLGGFYHHAVYGGKMMPDRMAQILHENHGIGDGSPDEMWKAVQQAVDLRRKQTVERQGYAKLEKQATSFDKDAMQEGTAKGKTQVYASNLGIGDKVTIGDQDLKVIGIDPKTMDVELEDHSKYGVQKVAEGTALYVEKVQPADGSHVADGDDARLAAARPDPHTGSLFGDDEPFDLRGDTASDPERVAAALEQARRAPADDRSTLPQLRPGEKGTADLFQGDDQPFNLAGETAIDHGARQQEQERQARDTAFARAQQDLAQPDLIAPTATRLTYPPNLFDGGQTQSRRADLVREAYASGELSQSPETGLWARGPKTARTARELVAPDELTLSERRTILDRDKEQVRQGYRQAGQPVPENPLAAREATLKAREDALARFTPRDESTLAAAAPGAEQPGGARTPDPTRTGSVKDLVDEALDTGSGERKRYAALGTVNPEQAAQLKASTGLDLDGYRRNLDNSTVRHIWREHGNASAEVARGNAPLSRADFERLPEILQHPDASILAGKNSRGQDVIMHAKRVNGYFVVAEEVRDARGILSLSTVYKKSALPRASESGGEPASALLPSTAQGILRQAADNFNRMHGRGEAPVSERSGSAQMTLPPADANHAAFSPESGTLGVPRDQMPQVAAEHRGALANFLAARGMDVSAQDELPGSLKPSQADFNPAKVARAGAIREAGTATERRILTSADGHVIDGHHQWLDRLANTPDEPMPTLRINAPAKDILSQIHEFPSAGMEKAPDLNDEGTLAAAKPGTDEATEDAPGVGARIKNVISGTVDKLIGTPEHRALVDRIAAGKNAVDTMAGRTGIQAGHAVEMDMPDQLDRQAAGVAVEAGYNPRVLAEDLAKAKASPDPKLAARFTPILQHAIDNLPRLRDAAEGFREIDAREDSAAEAAGLSPRWQNRVKHILNDPTSPESTLPMDFGFGATKGFKKSVDAVAAGVDPGSTDLAGLTSHMVTANRRAINEHEFQNGLSNLRAEDGKPVLGGVIETNTKLNDDGTVNNSQKLPKGYDAVQAGPNVLTVHKQFAPLLKSLYGESAFDTNNVLSGIKSLTTVAKHGTAVFDVYHGSRILTKAGLGFQTFGYDKGLAALDFAPEDRARAVAAGKITQADADWAGKHDAAIDRGLKAGLNVGAVSDNLLSSAKQHGLFERLPVVGKALTATNDLIFKKITRGAMTQAFTVAAERNRTRFPDMSEAELDRRSAKEVNEFFGNLGSQGFLKSKTLQDAARVIGFAPQWTESQIRSEVRGYGQAAKSVSDALQGKGVHVGVVAQAMGGTLLAGVVASQALNLFTRGKTTWQNDEAGHQWDAWIPGGPNNRGFWFSPLSVAAEYAHEMRKYTQNGNNALDAVAHIASNKLSGPVRGANDLVTGQDYAGRPFGSMGERVKAAAADTLPSPMPLSGVLQKDPKAPLGYGLNHQPGSMEKQIISMAGLKVDAAPSARAQMYRAAEPFRANGGGGAHAPSAYGDLRHMLDIGDMKGAADEMHRLTSQGGKSMKDLSHAMGIRDVDESVRPELFTGNGKTDHMMYDKLSVPERKVYQQAQREHTQIAERFKLLRARASGPLVAN